MDNWTIVLTGLVASVIIYYFYLHRKKNYFDERGIPYESKKSIIRTTIAFLFRGIALAERIQTIYSVEKKAKYVGFFDFNSPTLMIRDTELIKSMAVKNFDHFVNHRSFIDPAYEPLFGNNLFALHDQRWRDVRALLSPAFTSSKMKAMFKLMQSCGETFSGYLAEGARQKSSEVINSKDAFCRYTTDVIATCAFGISVDSMKNPDNEFYVLGKKATSFGGATLGIKFLFLRLFPNLGGRLGIRFFDVKVEQFFTNLVRETIEMRDAKGITRPDMIQLMMETRGNEAIDATHLNIQEMTSQAFIFFFGGFESTSVLMCYAAHELAANPKVQAKLGAEIDECLAQCSGDVTYEAVNGLKYLDAVINEALRLYPVAPFLDRVCSKSFELPPALPGLPPHTVKPGEFIWFPPYALQRDSQYFNEPDKFIPERFIDDPKGTIHSPAYMVIFIFIFTFKIIYLS